MPFQNYPDPCGRDLKVMLHETIRNDDFLRNTVLPHCCDIVSDSYNIVATLQRYVAQTFVVANRLMQHHI